jgi:hypothetical protein
MTRESSRIRVSVQDANRTACDRTGHRSKAAASQACGSLLFTNEFSMCDPPHKHQPGPTLGRRRARMATGGGEMDDGLQVRRIGDGSIDIAFYVARARRLRAQANVELFRSMRRCVGIALGRLRTWLRSRTAGGWWSPPPATSAPGAREQDWTITGTRTGQVLQYRQQNRSRDDD